MKTHQREILIYYNPDSSNDRKTVAHAQSLVQHVRTYTFDKAPSTGTSWQQIIKALDMHPKALLNKAHPYYQANIRGRDFDDQGWLDVIKNNPALIKAPIAIRGDKAILCTSATDIYRLTMEEAVAFY
jgi:arsenate reductase